jgi:ribosomal protein S12 methylthiotransferase accessory factor
VSELASRVFNHRRPVVKPSLTGAEAAALAEVESLYSPYGVLRLFSTYFRPGPGLPMHVGHGQYFDFDHVLSRMLDRPGLTSAFGAQVFGGGKGMDMFDMYVSSIGEGIERLLGSLAGFERLGDVRYGTWQELTSQGLDCLHPEQCPIFAKWQYTEPHFAFEPWTEDTHLGWLPGHRLLSGARVYVPAQLVLFVYHLDRGEPRIGLAPSGGLASHISTEEAALHAVCEVTERDALNLRWHGRIPLDRVVLDVEPPDPAIAEVLRRMRASHAMPRLYYHNLDFEEFPTVTVIGYDDWVNRFAYTAGGGVGPNLVASLRSGLTEYAQAERCIRLDQLARGWKFGPAFEALFDIREDAKAVQFVRFVQAIAYYGYARHAAEARWYFDDGPEIPLSELIARDNSFEPEPSARMRGALRRRGLDPVMFDFTPRGLRHTRLWKAFMPELTQPYPQHAPALGHPRYMELARASGVPGAATSLDDLLTRPLPYP